MAKNSSSQDEFVDLYDVLDMAENADGEELRKRINTLYIEAQQNLDHRNVKKRLQFQQMYEIYLPQARHLLLDRNRRAEYDRYLHAYRTGSKVDTTAEPVHPVPPEPPVGEIGKVAAADLPEIVEEAVDPEQLAVEREAMWAKWKTGLEIVNEDAETPLEPLPGAAAPEGAPPSHAEAAPRQRPVPVVPRMNRPATQRPASQAGRPRPPQPGAIRTPGGPPSSTTPSGAHPRASEMEKQREQQRYQLIKDAVQTAGLMWGAGIGIAVFIAGGVILFFVDGILGSTRLGMPRMLFNLICFVIVLLATAIGGLLARKKAKKRAVAELSALSLEELLRRSR